MLFVEPGLPAIDRLDSEGIKLSAAPHPESAVHIGVMNLMPIKTDTETDLLRAFSSSPADIKFSWLHPQGHVSKNTPLSHIRKFYKHCTDTTIESINGLIITGAPLEKIKFEDVDYWNEFTHILDYCHSKNKPVLLLCWAAFAALHHHFGLETTLHQNKLSGIFSHEIISPDHPLLNNITPPFNAPQSRFVTINVSAAESSGLKILAYNPTAGMHVGTWENETYVTGHGEYETNTLFNEYHRDLAKGMNPSIPTNYLDRNGNPVENWQKNGSTLFNNWISSIID